MLLLSGTLHSVLTSVFLMLEKLPKEPIMAMGRAAAKPREDVVSIDFLYCTQGCEQEVAEEGSALSAEHRGAVRCRSTPVMGRTAAKPESTVELQRDSSEVVANVTSADAWPASP